MDNQKLQDIHWESKTKSEADFENMIGYLAGGTVALSMAFIHETVDLASSTLRGFLYFGWVCLTLCLLLNVVAHLISSRISAAAFAEIDEINKLKEVAPEDEIDVDAYNQAVDAYNQKKPGRVRVIDNCNVGIVSLLGIGLISLIIFCSYNISLMKPVETNHSDPIDNEKGRTMAPVTIKPIANAQNAPAEGAPTKPAATRTDSGTLK